MYLNKGKILGKQINFSILQFFCYLKYTIWDIFNNLLSNSFDFFVNIYENI